MFVRIDSSSIDDNKLFDMCKTSEFSEDPTAENMQFLDWNNRPETLLHQNFKQKVYDEGGYFVYEEGGVYLGGGGFYPFEGDVNIVVFPVRLYVIPTLGIKKNMEVIQKLIAYMTDVIKTTTEYRGSVFFVNDHNLWRLKSLKSMMDPTKRKLVPFPDLKMVTYDKQVRYKNTEQTAVYFDFDYNDSYEQGILECLQKLTI